MDALLTGLGIGIAFWVVVIPCVILAMRYPTEKKSSAELLNEKIGEAWDVRNRLHSEEVKWLKSIAETLDLANDSQ